ncbi:F-box protein-like [Dorcoceras hygrometricum]|uniref:F-box protein-like n=1 Tax=Dorcoceras hygrometricum TaxID=472368 RepID=A0A2Z7C6G0_9LAMI|nr:F-box protein-like [Dorcoceras hygrometricum]
MAREGCDAVSMGSDVLADVNVSQLFCSARSLLREIRCSADLQISLAISVASRFLEWVMCDVVYGVEHCLALLFGGCGICLCDAFYSDLARGFCLSERSDQ